VEGAAWYRLYLTDTTGMVYEYLLAALGRLVPVSDLDHPDEYTAWVVALDANGNELCRTARKTFLMDRPYCGGLPCEEGCRAVFADWCRALYAGDSAGLAGCMEGAHYFCDWGCGTCPLDCQEVCQGDPECEEMCQAECTCIGCVFNCELGCLRSCSPGDLNCLATCMGDCFETTCRDSCRFD